MNVLVDIFKTNSKFEIKENSLIHENRQYNKDTMIDIDGALSRKYSLHELAFYLSHQASKYGLYMSECNKLKITYVRIEDQRLIKEILEKYTSAPEIQIDGPEFRYLTDKDFAFINKILDKPSNLSTTGAKLTSYIVIVPSSITSPVTLTNVEQFLSSGVYQMDSDDFFADKRKRINVCGYNLDIRDSTKGFTLDDWKTVVAIFLDGSKWQIRNLNVHNILNMICDIPVFCFYDKENSSRDSTRELSPTYLLLDGGKCKKKDFKDMWSSIKHAISSKL